jgi:hypothetical protein
MPTGISLLGGVHHLRLEHLLHHSAHQLLQSIRVLRNDLESPTTATLLPASGLLPDAPERYCAVGLPRMTQYHTESQSNIEVFEGRGGTPDAGVRPLATVAKGQAIWVGRLRAYPRRAVDGRERKRFS